MNSEQQGLGVSPAARGPGFARSRAANNAAQLRRASTATNRRGGTVSALRARIPDAVDHRPHAFGPAGRSRLRRAVFVGGRAPHTPTFRHRGVRWRGGRQRAAAAPVAAAAFAGPSFRRGISNIAAHRQYCAVPLLTQCSCAANAGENQGRTCIVTARNTIAHTAITCYIKHAGCACGPTPHDGGRNGPDSH